MLHKFGINLGICYVLPKGSSSPSFDPNWQKFDEMKFGLTTPVLGSVIAQENKKKFRTGPEENI